MQMCWKRMGVFIVSQELNFLIKIFIYLFNVYLMTSVVRWTGHVARIEEKNTIYRILVGKTEGKSPLGRP
jgi:hypothetical protein